MKMLITENPVLYITITAPVSSQLISMKHNLSSILNTLKYIFDIKIRIKYF